MKWRPEHSGSLGKKMRRPDQAKYSSIEKIHEQRKSELRDLLAEAARNTAALPVEDER